MTQSTLSSILPAGVPATRQWLLSQGFSVSRLDNALKSGRVVPVSTAVYARPDLPVTWQAVAFALQREQAGVVIGGVTSFELLGKGHFVPMSKRQAVSLFSTSRPPGWLRHLPLNVDLQWHGTARLWGDMAAPGEFCTQAYQWREDLPPLIMARPERALLEVLSLVPKVISFELADSLFQGLTSLSPAKMAVVMQTCTSVKVKRLYFWLASRYDYPWTKHLQPQDYDLGSGKRLIAPGGKLDKRFMITVPEALYDVR